MIDREHDLSITKQAAALKISRGSVLSVASGIVARSRGDATSGPAASAVPFAGSRMLRGLLAAEGARSAAGT